MATIHTSVLIFITTCLSTKSQQYIQNELFVSEHPTNRILAENPRLKSEDKDLLIGELLPLETELFIIRQSLSKRIAGTRERMGEIHNVSVLAPQSEIEKAKQKYHERCLRLDELLRDYRRTYHYLNALIKDRLKDTIYPLVEKESSNLYKKLYNGFDSGFDFKIVDTKNIVLTNTSEIGGD